MRTKHYRGNEVIGPPTWLPPGYSLQREPDILSLRGPDGSVVGRFSVRGTTREAVLQLAEDDRLGLPHYDGPEEHAKSVERMVRARLGSSWESFVRTERRMLEARKNGQLAKALARRLPGESLEKLDRITCEDRRMAEEGLLELRNEAGELSYKRVEELSPEDRQDRMRAELARLEWLLERQGRRNVVLRWAHRAVPARNYAQVEAPSPRSPAIHRAAYE